MNNTFGWSHIVSLIVCSSNIIEESVIHELRMKKKKQDNKKKNIAEYMSTNDQNLNIYIQNTIISTTINISQ